MDLQPAARQLVLWGPRQHFLNHICTIKTINNWDS